MVYNNIYTVFKELVLLVKRFMIIDGNSLLHRAFHALPPLMTKDGIYTNGVYGFLTMFYKVTEEYKPDYISVVFDRKAPTFRHIEFEEYKAGRAKTPDELGMQFPILKEIIDNMNIHRVELDGFEADDLAGTLSKIGEKNGLEVVLVTGDKDYLQLASDKTKVLLTRKGISNIEVFDKQAVIERYELTPQQFIDLKGLMGDKSDNIPGVPGVGEKTGIKLLKEFNSIEGIYNNIEKVDGKKLKEKLIEYRNQAIMSRRLSEIITSVPINVKLEDLILEEPNVEELLNIYKKLEFNSLLGRLNLNKDTKKDTSNAEKLFPEANIIKEKEYLKHILKEIESSKSMIFKYIIDGDHPLIDDILGIGISISEKTSYYVDLTEGNICVEDFFDSFKYVLENDKIKKIGHNIKEEILVSLRYGVDINGIIFDSMIGQYLLNPSQNDYSLKVLADDYLNIDIEGKESLLGTGKNKKTFGQLFQADRVSYMSNELGIISRLKDIIENTIVSQNMDTLFYEVEIPLISVLANMEYLGFTVDEEKLKELGRELDGKIDILTQSIFDIAGEEFNINSPKQLGEILFERLKLPAVKKTKTGYSTNAEVLESLAEIHPIAEKILEYRQLVKLKSTYVDGLISVIDENTGKVHSSFNQTITTTGRISSTEPNLQNIPIRTEEGRKIRKVFVPSNSDYTLVDADYSQIELRVLASISDDPKLKEAFFTGEDIHRKTASEVFDVKLEDVTQLMRSRAKAVNFGIVYGISDYGLARDLKISKKEAKLYIDNYLKNYVKVKEYMKNIIDEGKSKGYVETILHRRRYLPELSSRNFNIRSFGERMAMNTPIQGSAADIIKLAMVNVYNELKKRGLKSRLILQVHDELIIEAHKEEVEEVKTLLKDLMENAIPLNVPLSVDMETGDSWYDTK
ncbi:DNA polymerase I [Proteiniborus sp. MB09-C3]|uniref:DNA polymerase I n=1 Tax=Proteiniborus sp. MB09-C3 TaxID=3050072 RepID=UPI0025578872|nr:DNA polymerase I [Proteiniborus sp. MB09-C3]WIV10518.1 DNA polymerase I [Proteiniborus sp. MB09-C3]